jgi:hypothetical protein
VELHVCEFGQPHVSIDIEARILIIFLFLKREGPTSQPGKRKKDASQPASLKLENSNIRKFRWFFSMIDDFK